MNTEREMGRLTAKEYWELKARAALAAERIAELEAALSEAIEDIEDWASYADEYFREKHDLQGCLEKHRAKLDAQEKDDEL